MKLIKKIKGISTANCAINKLTYSLLFTLFAFGVNAQNEEVFNPRQQGKILANGNLYVHYTNTNVNGNKSTLFSTDLTPKAGYFIMDNLAVGLELGIGTSKKTGEDSFGSFTTSTTTLSAGLFSRYYLINGFFGEGLVAIGTSKADVPSKSLIPLPKLTTTIFSLRAGVGYAIPLGKNIALEPTVNYAWIKNMPKDAPSGYKDITSSIFLGVGFTAFL